MTTQLINEATYNAFITIPVDVRTAEMQEQIEAYEAHHNLNVDAEEHAPEASVEPTVAPEEVVDTKTQPVSQDAANDESEAPEWTVDAVEQDAELAEQMKLSLNVLDDQLSIADQRYKHFLALAAKATCLVKWTGPFILDVRVNDETKDLDFAKHVANTLGLLSFNHLLAESVLNKEIKEYQVKNKYVTICSVPLQAKRDSAVDKYDEVKKGCQFVVHTQAMKYEHNDDLNIAKLENIFSSEEIKESYKETSTPILRVRLTQQEWVEKHEEKLANLVAQFNTQHKVIAPKVKAETFKAWSGILVLALLWDKAIYADMVKLMNEHVGVQGLEVKVKLACALSVVVPEYQAFVQRFNAEEHITTVVLKNLLKGLGLKDHEISNGFVGLGLQLGKNLSGFNLSTLTAKVEENVDSQDTDVKKYIKNLRSKLEPEVAKAA
ncbi:Uncharacterised protein [Acinetobacter baumannii]|uniref:hypothetical protein n=1 Tax=Acinetobacter baumannii TaxID=470 RepID=UPI000DE67DD2|nr:hypothetical protein [Acinetobacter baumannii]SSR14423.1 Uncharacterised protein [Acinetobacter baumannii]